MKISHMKNNVKNKQISPECFCSRVFVYRRQVFGAIFKWANEEYTPRKLAARTQKIGGVSPFPSLYFRVPC